MDFQFTERQKLELESVLAHGLFATAFKQFLYDRIENKRTDAELLSEDITKLLKREQALGAAAALSSLLEDFRTHVENNTTSTSTDQ